MRTVHETEALRPSDPIPKALLASMQSHPKLASKLKLIVKTPQPDGQTPPPANGISNGHEPSEWTTKYPPELGFTPEEEARRPDELYKSLRRTLKWTKEDAEELKKQVEEMEELRRHEWMEKEILLDQAIEADKIYHKRRQEIVAGRVDIPSSIIKAAVSAESEWNKTNSPLPGGTIVLGSPAPSKAAVEENSEAAAVLVSMQQV